MKINSASFGAFRSLFAVAATLLAVAPVFAQAPGGGGFDPSSLTPEQRAGIAKMRKFRDDNKQVFALGQTVRALEEFDANPKTKFTPAQASAILGVINKWKAKPSITNEQATQINKDLTKSLSIAQIKALAAAASRRGGRGGGGGQGGGGGFGGGGGRPGGGAPGGGGGFGGGRPGGGAGGAGGGWKMPELKPFNPLNPATGISRNPEMAKRRMSELTTLLATRAKAK